MAVVSGNKVPIYTQIAQTIKQRVRTGLYRSGDALPSIRTIGKEFGVSVKAVHQAMRTLEESGVVQAHPGKGIVVTAEEQCQRTAIIFGVIHPYHGSMYQCAILDYIDEAFSERSNLAVVRSSKDDPSRERDIAEHLVANGAKGLVLWPTNNDPNGEFFQSLSQKVPVVLMDRLLGRASLPAVTLDYYSGGREIGQMLLGTLKKRRLLVIMDNLHVSSYADIVSGIQSVTRELDRTHDVTVMHLPLTQMIAKFNNGDYSETPQHAEYLARIFRESNYDAVFCSQNELLEECVAQTGLAKHFPEIQWATLWGTNSNRPKPAYRELNRLEWLCDPGAMITEASQAIQRWVLTRKVPTLHTQIKLTMRVFAGSACAQDQPSRRPCC